MAVRKSIVQKAVAESVKAAAEAGTASVVKTDKKKPVAKKPVAKKPARKYAEPKDAPEPKKTSQADKRVQRTLVTTGKTPAQQRTSRVVKGAEIEGTNRRKAAATQASKSTRVAPILGPKLDRSKVSAPKYIKNDAEQVADMFKDGTLKKFLRGNKRK